MKTKIVLGALLVAALMVVGGLAGSVIGSASASTRFSTYGSALSAAASPTTVPSTSPNTGGNGAPWGGKGHGMRGAGGMGFGMRGGGGFGPGAGGPGFKGQGATADSATRAISNTTSLLNLIKGDLTYATGKMDTTAIQGWLNGATALLQRAESANSNKQYEQSAGYARAADQLAQIAESQMAQTLGADKLPSYSQQQRHFNRPGANNTNVTQAQASRMLASTYQNLVMQAAVTKGSSDATQYLTDAENTYKTAYDQYNAGKYGDAVGSARLAEQLASVARELAEISSLPADPNAPVTVPAPNF